MHISPSVLKYDPHSEESDASNDAESSDDGRSDSSSSNSDDSKTTGKKESRIPLTNGVKREANGSTVTVKKSKSVLYKRAESADDEDDDCNVGVGAKKRKSEEKEGKVESGTDSPNLRTVRRKLYLVFLCKISVSKTC